MHLAIDTEYIRKKTGSGKIIFSPEFLRESKALDDNAYPIKLVELKI